MWPVGRAMWQSIADPNAGFVDAGHAEVAALHETLNQTEVATATPAEVAAVHEEVTDDRGL